MYGIQDKINQILRGAETIRKNQSMLTAQSDSIELYHALCDMTKDLTEKTNEVARLRELLNRAIDIAKEYQKHACKNINEDCDWSMQDTHIKFDAVQAEAKLAPEPEEQANPTCSNTTHKHSYCDCKEPSEKDTSTETCPSYKDNEWRELGHDEVIQEGDEVQPKHHIGGEWIKAWSFELGVKAGHFKAMRYRTRRPTE